MNIPTYERLVKLIGTAEQTEVALGLARGHISHWRHDGWKPRPEKHRRVRLAWQIARKEATK